MLSTGSVTTLSPASFCSTDAVSTSLRIDGSWATASNTARALPSSRWLTGSTGKAHQWSCWGVHASSSANSSGPIGAGSSTCPSGAVRTAKLRCRLNDGATRSRLRSIASTSAPGTASRTRSFQRTRSGWLKGFS